ncbi:MAG: MaoC/PaaZ C-terminal domain-containing protein [Nitrospinota bacterium]
MAGLCYEDFAPGQAWTTAPRALGEAEVTAFAGLSGDRTYLHTDPEAAARGPFGERVAHGLLGLSVLSGLMMEMGFLAGTVEAFMGLTWRFTGPIRFGDRVHGEVAVKETRLSRKGQGLVTFALRMKNQRDETVQEGEFTMLVRRRGEPIG